MSIVFKVCAFDAVGRIEEVRGRWAKRDDEWEEGQTPG